MAAAFRSPAAIASLAVRPYFGFVDIHQGRRADLSPPASDQKEGTMTYYPVREMEAPSSDDPPELTEAAELHIMLLPSDQWCPPAGERDGAD